MPLIPRLRALFARPSRTPRPTTAAEPEIVLPPDYFAQVNGAAELLLAAGVGPFHPFEGERETLLRLIPPGAFPGSVNLEFDDERYVLAFLSCAPPGRFASLREMSFPLLVHAARLHVGSRIESGDAVQSLSLRTALGMVIFDALGEKMRQVTEELPSQKHGRDGVSPSLTQSGGQNV